MLVSKTARQNSNRLDGILLTMSKAGEDYLLNPPPGSANARAVELGIDLTLTLENLRLTPRRADSKVG